MITNKIRAFSLLLFFALLLCIWSSDKFANGELWRNAIHQGVNGNILRYGTLGSVLSEAGLLQLTNKKEFTNLEAPAGGASVSFTINTDSPTPVRGQFFWFQHQEPYFTKDQTAPFKTPSDGKVTLKITNLLNQISGIGFNLYSANTNIKISNIKIIDNFHRTVQINSSKQYQEFTPMKNINIKSLDQTGLSLQTGIANAAAISYKINNKDLKINWFARSFKKKRAPSNFIFKATTLKTQAGGPNEQPSEKIRLPVLSIKASDGQFEGEDGIITNRLKHGRRYERVVDISYFDETGKKIVSSPVGIRFHGGKSRAERKSYKLYFRGAYGSSEAQQSLIFPNNPLPIKSLVVHHTEFPYFSPIAHLLAIDFYESIGIDVPRRQPVIVYINNISQGLFYLTDHLSKDNFDAYFGTKDFSFYRFKSNNFQKGKIDLNISLNPIRTFLEEGGEFPKKHIYESFDVEALTNFMIANTVFNTHDYCQGILYRRDDLGEKKWKMIGWDFDGAFMKNFEWTIPRVKDTYNPVREASKETRQCPYSVVFKALLENSPEYRAYFQKKFHRSLETVFSTETMKHRLAFYREKYEGKLGITPEGFDMLDSYFEKRPAFIKKQTDKHLAYWDTLDNH